MLDLGSMQMFSGLCHLHDVSRRDLGQLAHMNCEGILDDVCLYPCHCLVSGAYKSHWFLIWQPSPWHYLYVLFATWISFGMAASYKQCSVAT